MRKLSGSWSAPCALALALSALVPSGLCSSALVSSALARAPDTFEEDFHEPVIIESPKKVVWEFRFGPYQPSNAAFKDIFNDDKGWLFATEVDITAYEIPFVGQLAVGLGAGWASYSAKATVIPGGGASGETTKFTLIPLNAMGVLRIDALARHTVIPLTFAGKLGADFVRWKATTGSNTDASGLNVGLRWAAQAALELDFIDPRSARRLDDEFGINHMFVFGEFLQSRTKTLGDRTIQFGLGAQF